MSLTNKFIAELPINDQWVHSACDNLVLVTLSEAFSLMQSAGLSTPIGSKLLDYYFMPVITPAHLDPVRRAVR